MIAEAVAVPNQLPYIALVMVVGVIVYILMRKA
jgi:hypothetical protein